MNSCVRKNRSKTNEVRPRRDRENSWAFVSGSVWWLTMVIDGDTRVRVANGGNESTMTVWLRLMIYKLKRSDILRRIWMDNGAYEASSAIRITNRNTSRANAVYVAAILMIIRTKQMERSKKATRQYRWMATMWNGTRFTLVNISVRHDMIVTSFFLFLLPALFCSSLVPLRFIIFGRLKAVLDCLPFPQMHVGGCRRGGWGWGWSTPFPDSDNC